MPHDLTIRSDGTAEAFYAGNGVQRRPAWHGLGTNVLNALNSIEAIQAAKLDWTVCKLPLSSVVSPEARINVPGDMFVTVREDNRNVLGVVGRGYVPVQNAQAFEFLDSLNQDGIVKYESAGSLKGGRVVWLLARLNSIFEVAEGDIIEKYVLFSTSHDGSSGIRILPTTVRVVCQNTLTVAIRGARKGAMITIKHDRLAPHYLDTVSKTLREVDGSIEEKMQKARLMVRKIMHDYEFERYMDLVLSFSGLNSDNALQKAKSNIRWNFTANPNQQIPGIARSVWAAYNAVSEFIDHSARYRGPESRFVSVLEGTGNSLKQRAFDAALSLV